MTSDVQAARERLESAADNPTSHFVSLIGEDQTWLVEVDCDDLRTILSVLATAEELAATAERERDEAIREMSKWAREAGEPRAA